MTRMTRAQFATLVAQQLATFKTKKDGIEWYQLRDGSWFGAKDAGLGLVDVKRFAAGACACG